MNWSICFTGVTTAAGWIGVLVEFVRPGWVLPGVTGAVLLLYGLARALPEHPVAALAWNAPFLMIALWMLAAARKASRNKSAL